MQEILLAQSRKRVIASDTELLLHYQGANGSTTFIDSSPNPKQITPSGAIISTAQKLYGVSSGQFTTSGAVLEIKEAFPTEFNKDAWTIETFVRSTGAQTYSGFFSLGNNNGSGNGGGIIVTTEGVFIGIASGWFQGGPVLKVNWSVSDWRHYALTYDGSILSVFFNGTRVGTVLIARNQLVMNFPKSLLVGKNWTNSNSLNGYLAETRLSKGIVYNGATYTVPTPPLQNIT